jgi:MATE family multidrug resistance protein
MSAAIETLAEARRLARLAWPVVLTSLNWTLMHLIDVAVVGHAGTAELGALAAARAILYVVLVTGLSGLSGVLVFVARDDGAGRPEASGETMRAGALLAALIGTLAALALALLAEPLILGAGVAPDLAPAGARVCRVMALAFPAQFVVSAISYFLEGASRPQRVTAVNFSLLPLNALLAWMLADGRLGAPAWGAVGAATATVIASWIGLGLIIVAAWTLPDGRMRGVRDLSRAAWAQAWRQVPDIARFGAVPALSAGLELVGFSILIALSTRIGMVTAAAFQAVFSLHNLGFALGLGMASAAGVRVGNAVGAGEPEQARFRAGIAAGMALALMAALAIIYIFAAPAIVGLFSSDPPVVALSATLLVAWAPFMPFDGLQVVFLFALRSLGDQVAAGVNGIIAFFVVTGGLGWLLVALGYGAWALMAAAAAGMVAAAGLQGVRLLIVCARLVRSPTDGAVSGLAMPQTPG